MTENWLTFIALLSWPIVAFLLYRRKRFALATVWTILGGYLLLPSQAIIKIPMIPSFDKNSIPNLCCLLAAIVMAPRQKPPDGRSRAADILIFVYLVSPILTSAFNNDDVVVGGRVLPGVGNYDAISAILSQFLFFLPIFIGRRYLRSIPDALLIMRALVIGGLLYSIPMLIELRLSPQLSNWIYGYFPSSYAVEGRLGGYRPVVFLNNGLMLAFFTMTCLLASLILWRAKVRYSKFPAAGISFYLAVMLVFCKSAGALTDGVVGAGLVRFFSPKLQIRVATVLVCIGLIYPALRAADLFPTQTLVDLAEKFSPDRAASLKYRFVQEDQLLARAWQRFFFGWGRYGRSRVYSEETGNDLSVTDGAWIITMGSFGAVGFLAQFGLLALPVLRAGRRLKYLERKEALIFSGLSVILSLSVIEQLPNASISPWTWLLAGSLLGQTEFVSSRQRSQNGPGERTSDPRFKQQVAGVAFQRHP